MRHDDAASPYSLDAGRIDERSLIEKFAGKTVFFDGVFKGDYSLAIVNRQLAQALIDLGINLTCHTAEDDWQSDINLAAAPDIIRRMRDDYPFKETFDIHLRNTWPPVTHNMVGRQNAYVAFAWEELEFPQYLVDRFNRDLDLVTVISNFVHESFERSGVTIPVEVTGNGCDHLSAIADDVPPPLPDGGRRRILHVSSCFPRKGVDVLVDAFLNSFRADDPVELVIKTFPNPNNILASVLADRRDRLAEAPSSPSSSNTIVQASFTRCIVRPQCWWHQAEVRASACRWRRPCYSMFRSLPRITAVSSISAVPIRRGSSTAICRRRRLMWQALIVCGRNPP